MNKILSVLVISLLTFFSCSKDTSEPTPLNPNGPFYSRAWESENKNVCFWVSEDRLSAIPHFICDGGSLTITGLPGTYSNGFSCDISLRYTETIPIRDSKFSITNYEPEPGGSIYTVQVTFAGNKATGNVTEVNRYGVTCTASFEAVA